jgi:hypothetical protein
MLVFWIYTLDKNIPRFFGSQGSVKDTNGKDLAERKAGNDEN